MNKFFNPDQYTQTFFQIVAVVGEEGVQLVVGLFVLLMVEHAYGTAGLGLMAFLLAAMFGLRFVTTYGVARYIEVGIAETESATRRNQLIQRGFQAVLVTSTLGALLLLVLAFSHNLHTLVGEKIGAFLLLAILFPLANINSLKFAALNGLGQHSEVARQRIRRHVIVLLLVWFFTQTRLPPAILLSAYLIAEGITAWRLRRLLRLPGLAQVVRRPLEVVATLKKGQAYLFADHGLDLLLNIDLFILGFFVDDYKLGVYAEAAILVRLCLIISLGIKPVLRRQYTLQVQGNRVSEFIDTLGRHGALLFSLQSILALLTLLYYPAILDFFFYVRGETQHTFEIFLLFVPGLIFFSTFSALEPAFEALRKPAVLEKLTVTVTLLNLVLTAFLVPLAGIKGAAIATMLTMLLHFLFFGFWLPFYLEPGRISFLSAALGLYLLFLLLSETAAWSFLNFLLAPLLLLLVFYGCGLFGASGDPVRAKIEA